MINLDNPGIKSIVESIYTDDAFKLFVETKKVYLQREIGKKGRVGCEQLIECIKFIETEYESKWGNDK